MKTLVTSLAALVIAAIGFSAIRSDVSPAQTSSAQTHTLPHAGSLPVEDFKDLTFVFDATQSEAEPLHGFAQTGR